MINVEVIDDRLEVRYSGVPDPFHISLTTLICGAASEPYHRGESNRWFTGGPSSRPLLTEVNGRPC